MKIGSLVALAGTFLLAAAAVSAVEAPSLEQIYSGALQTLKPQAAALQQSVKTNAAQTMTPPPIRRERDFNLEFEQGSWHLRPDPNPPGERLTIDVDEGNLVQLELVNRDFRNADGAQFLIDGIEATVNGKPSRGIEVWLRSAGDRAIVEFIARAPGIRPINRSLAVGRLIIRRR